MYKKWKQKIKDLKLPGKMIAVYLTAAEISCILSVLALQLSLQIYYEQLYEKSGQELDFFAEQVNTQLTGIEDLSRSIATDDNIQSQLRKMLDLEYMSTAFSYESQSLRRMLLGGSMANSVIKNIVYTDGNKVRMTVGTYTGDIEDKLS